MLGGEPSWAWLLDPRASGRVALVDEPAIGLFDAALAARATGELAPRDIGNLSLREIGQLAGLLLKGKRRGHFSGFWKTAEESVQMMRQLKGRMLDIAYEYLNWWLSGWPDAVMARQGYSMSASRRVRDWLSPEEWDTWYEGEPAGCDLACPDGRVVVRQGESRAGGSYWRKASRIAFWNTTMGGHNSMARRWKDFIDASGAARPDSRIGEGPPGR